MSIPVLLDVLVVDYTFLQKNKFYGNEKKNFMPYGNFTFAVRFYVPQSKTIHTFFGNLSPAGFPIIFVDLP